MIKFLGGCVTLLLIWVAIETPQPVFISGAMFFLILTIGASSKLKYMYIFIGFSILFGTVARDLFLDEVYVIGSRFSYISSDENAKAYWIQMLLNVLFSLCLIGYGTYKAFYKKQNPSPLASNSSNDEAYKLVPTDIEFKERTDEIAKDLQRIVNLLEIPSTKELIEKSNQLFAELDVKYENDNMAKTSIEDSKDFFAKEIAKRMEHEAT